MNKAYSVLWTTALGIVLLTIWGCAAKGVVHNVPHTKISGDLTYGIRDTFGRHPIGRVSLILTFSGGGTRAAALAYGVLQELRDTKISVDGRPGRMLDEVDVISAVSGGSFTAAYYGLKGEAIFTQFERRFLRSDIQDRLLHDLFHPLSWFTNKGRTEMAAEYYRKSIFGDATFDDMKKQGGPLVLINASDLSSGTRFSFVQEYFNLLCSDIGTFQVAKAVAASSAVPLLFAPVVIENFQGCDKRKFEKALSAVKETAAGLQVAQAAEGLEKLVTQKSQFRYLHLVDGGITDNLGLRTFYEVIELFGGIKPFLDRMGKRPLNNSALIVVNAATAPAAA